MTGHTSGPWVVKQHQPGADGPYLIGANPEGDEQKNGGIYVAHAIGPEREANARLIAAAPALKEALERLLAGLLNEPRYRDHADTHAARAALRLVDAGE